MPEPHDSSELIAGLSRHDLYECCLQSAGDTVPLLHAIHGGNPVVLGEDFAGTAALSRAWVLGGGAGGRGTEARAIAVDHDPATLEEARRRADAAGVLADRLVLLAGDVRTAPDPAEHAADVVYAGNFSIGELLTRPDLVAYFRHVRARLRLGGIVACDIYGGDSTFQLGSAERLEPGPAGGPPGASILYTWEQREADPLTGRVENAVHFEVFDAEEQSLGMISDAFTYAWRMWSVPELRDAMIEAGFATTEIHARMPDAIDDDDVAYVRPIEDPDELEDSFDVLVVGRAG